MRKKVTVFAGFILMTFVFSMFRCGCNRDYGLNSIDASLKRITRTALDSDGDSYFVLKDVYNQADTVSIAFDSLAIEVKINYNLLSHNFNRNLPGIQSAYATSILYNYEKITDIIITSNKDYSVIYPAGTNLKIIVSVRGSYYVQGEKTVDDVIESGRIYGEHKSDPPPLLYTFDIPPETEEVHEITIKYITEKNQVFTAVIKNVKILK